MYLDDFIAKGFVITEHDHRPGEDQKIFRRVLEDELDYQVIMDWYKYNIINISDTDEIHKLFNYVKNYGCTLVAIRSSYSHPEKYLDIRKESPGEQITIAKGDIELFVDLDINTKFIYKIAAPVSTITGTILVEEVFLPKSLVDTTSVEDVLSSIPDCVWR